MQACRVTFWVTMELRATPPPQKRCLLTLATRVPLWQSFLGYTTLIPVFCLVPMRKMRTVSFGFYHQALQVELRISGA